MDRYEIELQRAAENPRRYVKHFFLGAMLPGAISGGLAVAAAAGAGVWTPLAGLLAWGVVTTLALRYAP